MEHLPSVRYSARERDSSLEISATELEQLSSQVVALVSEYFAGVSQMPVFPPIKGGDITRLLGSTLPLEGEPLEKLLQDCRAILNSSRHNGHPRFAAYIGSPATPPGAFADLIASTLNPTVSSWRSSPAPTEVEMLVVKWIGQLIDYSKEAHGLLTSGGSMANLLALLIAHRSRSDGSPSREGLWNGKAPMVIYASEQVHMSIPKAADVLGIGRNQVRLIETDEHFKIRLEKLREAIQADVQKGFRPFCVVASAGTVNTGAVDPIGRVADVAEEFDLWFHVDGAYGAPGALDPQKRSLFKGLNRADSVSLDPHKWFYTPIDCGCLLVRDPERARAAFSSGEVDYIKVHEQSDAESFAFWDYGIELSRRFRALKIWFTLKYYGVQRVAASIAEDDELAQYLGAQVEAADDFELLAPVELSICCFRYVPVALRRRLAAALGDEAEQLNVEIDDLNARIMHAVQRGGCAYFSSATLRGRFALRMCIVNFRTTRSDLDQTLEIIRETAERLGDLR